MNYSQMTNAELSRELRSLLLKRVPDSVGGDPSAHDLRIYQIELEIQNRELREVQKELEIYREDNAEMYHLAPVAYINFDESSAISAVNLAGSSFLKKERSYLLGMDFGIFLEPESARNFREHLRVCRELGGRRTVHLRVRTGHDIWVPTLVTTVFNDRPWPKKGFFFTMLQDLTEQKKTEALERQYAQDLEEKVNERTASLRDMNAEMELFSTSVAHDIRAPLRLMKGYAEVLLEEKAENLDLEAVEYITRIAKSADRLDQLLYDLLQYSRVSRDHLELRPVALGSLLKEVVEDQLQPADKSPPTILLFSGEENVLAHLNVLRQVLQNLLENARKFVRPGVDPLIIVRAEPLDARVRITVADNGIGIDPRYHRKIFSIFERLNGENYPGTGVGLAVARRAVERMGGQIGVESNDKGGSNFWIELRKAERSTVSEGVLHS